MTKILTSKGEELSRVLGEVFPHEHEAVKIESYGAIYGHRCVWCDKESQSQLKGECHARKYIPLDWPNAMKWRDWAVEKFGRLEFVKALLFVLTGSDDIVSVDWVVASRIIACDIEPESLLQAAALCVERKDNGH